MDDQDLLLFSRQVLMPNVGVENQQKLLDATVLVVGAGGLGNAVVQSLAASGVGRLIVVDDDSVEHSNLPRQFLFYPSDIGRAKATVVCERIQQRMPVVKCLAKVCQFSDALMAELYENGDMPQVIVDAGDNLALSLQLDAVATSYSLPLVHASVSRFEGHVYVRLPEKKFPPIQQVFQQASAAESCSQTGVLSVAVALLGSFQAAQVLRVLLAQEGHTIMPELVLFDGATMRFMPMSLAYC